MSILSTLFRNSAPLASKPASKPEVKPEVKQPAVAQTQPSQPTPSPVDLSVYQAQAREIILNAKDEALKLKDQAVRDAKIKLEAIEVEARSLLNKQQDLLREQEKVKSLEKQLELEKQSVEKVKLQLQDKNDELDKKLEKAAHLTKDEAKATLLEQVRKTESAEAAKAIRESEEIIRSTSEEKAREILVDAMRAGATDYVAEYTVSTVSIPDEETKGRIIGKDGRNIRVFEKMSGVDISMDETPGEVRLSSFSSVRREIARTALSRLIKDGRIQPARIEEYLERAKQDVERLMYTEGERLCHAVGVYNLPRDLIGMLGRFKYRTSYGQNMIGHTLEETRIGIKLAHEVKANVETVRMACLLHDIGKVVDDIEGSHVELGVNLLKKYNIPQAVINAVGEHHEDQPFSSKESVITYIADAISGSRPGARHENVEDYIKRLTRLEDIATSREGVYEAFAIQAGRELRVVVTPEKVSDDQMTVLASSIRDEIQTTMTYPGTVKVMVIRETRASEVAK